MPGVNDQLRVLISVLQDEELYRIRHRLKKQSDPVAGELSNLLTEVIKEREQAHDDITMRVLQ
jgi:hypothetical protein